MNGAEAKNQIGITIDDVIAAARRGELPSDIVRRAMRKIDELNLGVMDMRDPLHYVDPLPKGEAKP